MPTKKPDEVVNYRNSKTGRFVTKEYVEKHPKKPRQSIIRAILHVKPPKEITPLIVPGCYDFFK
jgi:hypothetical protein